MTDPHDNPRLKTLVDSAMFAREAGGDPPDFDATLSRAATVAERRSTLRRSLSAAAAVAAVALVATLGLRDNATNASDLGAQLMAGTSWNAPSDALLAVPGRHYYRELPALYTPDFEDEQQ